MQISLEKEMLVFTENFQPRNYIKSELDKNFTVDFSNNQVELVSDVHDNIPDLMKQMYNLLDEEKLINYHVWPLSQPGLKDYKLEFGVLSKEAQIYRQGLIKKYGADYMNISGIHYNVSYHEIDQDNPQQFYFELLKKIYIFAPIMLQFFSFTPVYQSGINDENLEQIGKNKGFKNSISLRNTNEYGYLNENKLNLDYSNYDNFQQSIKQEVEQGKLSDPREIYAKIRLKENKDQVYLELRFIDLNPFTRLGITFEQLTLLKLSLDYINTLKIEDIDINLANKEFDKVALHGLDKNIEININGQVNTLTKHTVKFLKDIQSNLQLNKMEQVIIQELLENYQTNNLDLHKFLNKLTKENLTIAQYGQQYSFKKQPFKPLYPTKNLELSTKILMQQAKAEQIEIQVLDEVENVLQLTKGNHKELVVQATKTNKDKYVNILMLENKVMTKKILQNNNIAVPQGQELIQGEKVNYQLFKQHKMVVKPTDTNFGLGISILDKHSTKEQIDKALDLAFKYNQRIIVEEFIQGTEYRFLVINDEVVSIVKRTPANVIGDGQHTIAELVIIKNQNPLRNQGYITPVEYLNLTQFELNYLQNQGLTDKTIPKKGEIIYLRENSNISTGGDSEEVFGKIPKYYKTLAILATQALGVNICGIDMIISSDFNEYAIIEANFNPAIQMHAYPYKGLGKNPAKNILKLLFQE